MMADRELRSEILSAPEFKWLGATLREQESARPMAVAVIRLCSETGLRLDEAASLRQSETDSVNSCLRLEKTKTGRSTRPVGKVVLDFLATLPKLHEEWLFPNRDGTGSADLKKSIAEIFDAAGLPDVRSQVLHRTFASLASDMGYSDATVDEILGHARRGVGQKHYIRRPDAALVAATDKVSARIAAMLDGREADVISISGKVWADDA